MQLFCGNCAVEYIDMEQEETLKLQVLEVCRDYLCRYLRLTIHISYLRSKLILTKDDDEVINAETTQRKKNEKFLDIISTKGSRGYDEFCNAIRQEGTTGHLLDRLNTELRRLSMNCEGREEMDEDARGLPKPGDPGAPDLPNPQPCSYNSSEA